jgi:hypothetical protein
LTHHCTSKNDLWAQCTVRVGHWLSEATADYVEDRGAIGLFPEETDQTYRRLAPAWVQLRIHALTDPEVDVRVHVMTAVLRRSAARALDDPSLFSLPRDGGSSRRFARRWSGPAPSSRPDWR